MIQREIKDLGLPDTSCAIVGNSGNILNHEYGTFIDSHDVVIRFNTAKISGYEKYVGSKTTCRIINQNLFHSTSKNITLAKRINDRFPNIKNAIYGFENEILLLKDEINFHEYEPVIKKIEKKNNKLFFLNDESITLCNKLVRDRSGNNRMMATSGLLGIMMSLGYFKKISCFGFGFFKENWDSVHYFESVTPYNNKQYHNFSSESLIVSEWVEKKIIDIYPEIKL